MYTIFDKWAMPQDNMNQSIRTAFSNSVEPDKPSETGHLEMATQCPLISNGKCHEISDKHGKLGSDSIDTQADLHTYIYEPSRE